MRHTLLAAVVLATATLPAAAQSRTQIAIVLDNSQSMKGFTDIARTKIKEFVLEYVPKNRSDSLEVALYVYGYAGTNPVNNVYPLTREVEEVLAKLDELVNDEKLSGGAEGPGRALRSAKDQLRWDPNATRRIVVVAGNESFDQTHTITMNGGTVSSPKGTEVARNYPKHKVRVRIGDRFVEIDCPLRLNTIFCGPKPEGERDKWEEGADLTRGEFDFIDPSALR